MQISTRALAIGTAVAATVGAVAFGGITYFDTVDSPTPFNLWENNLIGVALLSGAGMAAFSSRAGLGRGGVAIGLLLTGIGVGELIGGHMGARAVRAEPEVVRDSWRLLPPALSKPAPHASRSGE